jgi:transposase-like protein
VIARVLVQIPIGLGMMEGMQRFVPAEELFKGRHFDQEIVVLNVRWYLTYKLSYRDLVAMMAERGIDLAHTTILRWVQHYTPEFQKRWNCFARSVGGSWRMDETYVGVKGRWTYLYRAVDKRGQSVDFYLSPKRDVNAAKTFLRKAMKNQRVPTKITLDAYAASHRAVADLKDSGELPKRVKVRSCKYLNNIVEQDHRRVKQRLGPMGAEEGRHCRGGHRRHRTGSADQEGSVRKTGWTNRPDAGDLASRSSCVTGILSIEARRPTELDLIPDLHQNPYREPPRSLTARPTVRRAPGSVPSRSRAQTWNCRDLYLAHRSARG